MIENENENKNNLPTFILIVENWLYSGKYLKKYFKNPKILILLKLLFICLQHKTEESI
jgi:hypothetical protein